MAELEKEILKTESTPDAGATKVTQLLLRRKTSSQWGSWDQQIPIGEPCLSYDATTGDYTLKIGIPDSEGKSKMWAALDVLRCRVDDGELG